jgi:DNA (cytosine-5)-methyltransferase 1
MVSYFLKSCENVSNLLEVDDGQDWECIKSHIEDAGYTVHWKVINATEYLPQNRERLYIVCFDKSVPENDKFTWPEDSTNSVVVKDILEPLTPEQAAIHTLCESKWAKI